MAQVTGRHCHPASAAATTITTTTSPPPLTSSSSSLVQVPISTCGTTTSELFWDVSA